MLLWECRRQGLGTAQQVSPRPNLFLFSEATLTGQSPDDADTPPTSGQEGGHEYSGPGKAQLSLEINTWAEGLIHGWILINTHQMEACMDSDVKNSFLGVW